MQIWAVCKTLTQKQGKGKLNTTKGYNALQWAPLLFYIRMQSFLSHLNFKSNRNYQVNGNHRDPINTQFILSTFLHSPSKLQIKPTLRMLLPSQVVSLTFEFCLEVADLVATGQRDDATGPLQSCNMYLGGQKGKGVGPGMMGHTRHEICTPEKVLSSLLPFLLYSWPTYQTCKLK